MCEIYRLSTSPFSTPLLLSIRGYLWYSCKNSEAKGMFVLLFIIEKNCYDA